MIFFIDIPFKNNQRTSNFESYWSAVSYLVSGVIDTAHRRTAVSLTLHTTGQLCHWHRPTTVSSGIDTTDQISGLNMQCH
jgi:hypothetical protein